MGGMLGNKRQDRGKKFQGARNFGGGELLGKMQKKGGKTFLGECWGSCEPQQILGGNFRKNVKEKNLGGKFWGVVRRGACDAVGMVRNEKKGKIFHNQIYGGNFLEKCQRKKCDAVGMVPNEKKGKIFPKKI